MSVYNLLVRIGGDAKGLTTAMDSAVGGVKSGFGDIAKIAGGTLIADAIGSATRSIIDFGRASIESLGRIQTINAQTEAAIRSTGSAAGVTLQQINDLSGSIENLTGIEAESIQQGQNLLLTFTNIRNAAGAGNDIFDRTTKIMTDLSVAFGSDTRSAAIQLGKALNDPIQGVTALQRVGISFSASQRDNIKAMVESGNIMSAQKLILAELETQVGGSAMAYGQTMPGAIAKFHNALGTLGETIATSSIPLITTLSIIGADAINALAAAIGTSGVLGAFNQLISPEIKAGIIGIAGAITISMIPAITAAAASAVAAAAAFVPFITAAAGVGIIAYGIMKNWEGFKKFFVDLGKGMKQIAIGIYDNFRRYFNGALSFINSVINGIISAMKGIVGILPKQMQDAIRGLKTVIKSTPGAIQDGLDNISDAFKFTANKFKPLLVNGVQAAEQPAKTAAAKTASAIKKELQKPIAEVETSYRDWNLTLGPALADIASTITKTADQLAIDKLKISKVPELDFGEPKITFDFKDPFAAIKTEIKDAADSAVQTAQNLSEDIRTPLAKVQNQISDAFAPVGKLELGLRELGSVFNLDLVPPLISAVGNLGNFVSGIDNIVRSIPEIVNNIPKMIEAFKSIGTTLSNLWPIIQESGKLIMDLAMQMFTSLMTAIGPWGLLAAAIVATVAILWNFRDSIAAAGQSIAEFFNPSLKDARLAAEKAAKQVDRFNLAFADMDKQFKRAEAFPRTFNLFSEQINIAKQAIDDLLNDGLEPTNSLVLELARNLKRINIASVIESGALKGMQDSIRGFLEGTMKMADGLRIGIRNAIIDGIVEAAIQGTIVKNAFKPLLEQLSSQIAEMQAPIEGEPAANIRRMQGIRNTIQQIANQVPIVANELETFLQPIKNIVNELLPAGGPATAPAIPAMNSNQMIVNINGDINASGRQQGAEAGQQIVNTLRTYGVRAL